MLIWSTYIWSVSMDLNGKYEELTSSEADLIIDLYELISEYVRHSRPVTLVSLSRELDIPTSDLLDYLPLIVRIEYQVEKELEI